LFKNDANFIKWYKNDAKVQNDANTAKSYKIDAKKTRMKQKLNNWCKNGAFATKKLFRKWRKLSKMMQMTKVTQILQKVKIKYKINAKIYEKFNPHIAVG